MVCRNPPPPTPPRPAPSGVGQVARFGFDHGWHWLGPTFLNLQLPVLIVDHRLLPDPARLGLEPFGRRDPHRPLPQTTILAELHPGHMISLWQHTHPGPAVLLGWHRAAPGATDWPAGTGQAAVLIVGDSHRIQLSWAALWDGQIGRTRLIDTTRQASPEPATIDTYATTSAGSWSS